MGICRKSMAKWGILEKNIKNAAQRRWPQVRRTLHSKVMAKNFFSEKNCLVFYIITLKKIRNTISRLVRDLVQKAKLSEILWRSRIQAVPTISNLCQNWLTLEYVLPTFSCSLKLPSAIFTSLCLVSVSLSICVSIGLILQTCTNHTGCTIFLCEMFCVLSRDHCPLPTAQYPLQWEV